MLDYTKFKKKFDTITLPDGTVLHLLMPKKKTIERMMSLGKVEDGTEESQLDEAYSVAAEILSNNMQKKHFSANEAEDMLDAEELGALFEEYAKFVSEIKNDPN